MDCFIKDSDSDDDFNDDHDDKNDDDFGDHEAYIDKDDYSTITITRGLCNPSLVLVVTVLSPQVWVNSSLIREALVLIRNEDR